MEVQEELCSLPCLVLSDSGVEGDYTLPLGETFNLSHTYNIAFDYATQHGWEWIILLTSDAVLINHPSHYPSSGVASARCCFENEGQGITEAIKNTPCWWFSFFLILHRDIFTKYRWDENFRGYGHDDNDFLFNQLWFDDIKCDETDARTIHLWHPKRYPEPEMEEALRRNRKLYLTKLKTSYLRTGKPLPPHLEPHEIRWILG